jgi:hypothetical protein
MQVSVENRLASILAGVKDSSVAIEPAFFGDLICRQEKVSGDGRTIACNPCGIFRVKRWDYQNMGWCLRIQIIESDNVFVSQHDVRWDFTFNNLAENAVGI